MSGRLLMMASTPSAARNVTSAGESTVQTWTALPFSRTRPTYSGFARTQAIETPAMPMFSGSEPSRCRRGTESMSRTVGMPGAERWMRRSALALNDMSRTRDSPGRPPVPPRRARPKYSRVSTSSSST